MGIKVWIPGSPGNDPKMSVTDQCRSGVLCLNYKGTEIYSKDIFFLMFIDDNVFVYIYFVISSF